MKFVKECVTCGNEFTAGSAVAKYCDECKQRECVYCGASFIADGDPSRTVRFCSTECCDKHREAISPDPRECEWCGEVYEPRQDHDSRFCSYNCLLDYGREKIRKEDLHYDGPYDWLEGNDHAKGTAPPNVFTSEDVRGKNNPCWKEPIKFTCQNCGEEFGVKPHVANRDDRPCKYCSKECQSEYRKENLSGSDSPYYKGGINTYRGRGWKSQRMNVVDQQDGKCAKCGKEVGKSLPIHHITPFREFDDEQEANRLENLVGLCQSCHMRIENGDLTL